MTLPACRGRYVSTVWVYRHRAATAGRHSAASIPTRCQEPGRRTGNRLVPVWRRGRASWLQLPRRPLSDVQLLFYSIGRIGNQILGKCLQWTLSLEEQEVLNVTPAKRKEFKCNQRRLNVPQCQQKGSVCSLCPDHLVIWCLSWTVLSTGPPTFWPLTKRLM